MVDNVIVVRSDLPLLQKLLASGRGTPGDRKPNRSFNVINVIYNFQKRIMFRSSLFMNVGRSVWEKTWQDRLIYETVGRLILFHGIMTKAGGIDRAGGRDDIQLHAFPHRQPCLECDLS
jgi:hypothetical protein